MTDRDNHMNSPLAFESDFYVTRFADEDGDAIRQREADDERDHAVEMVEATQAALVAAREAMVELERSALRLRVMNLLRGVAKHNAFDRNDLISILKDVVAVLEEGK